MLVWRSGGFRFVAIEQKWLRRAMLGFLVYARNHSEYKYYSQAGNIRATKEIVEKMIYREIQLRDHSKPEI